MVRGGGTDLQIDLKALETDDQRYSLQGLI
jgi:hypothetical protein